MPKQKPKKQTPPVVHRNEKGEMLITANQGIALAGSLLSRSQFFGTHGLQYGGDRKIYEALGYKQDLTFEDYFLKFDRQDIGKAIIERPVKATWRNGVSIAESLKEETSAIEAAWAELDKRLSLQSKFTRLDRLTGIGRYGVLLLGLSDVREKEDLRKPAEGQNLRLMFVKPFSEGSAHIERLETRSANERFGLPTIYKLTMNGADGNSTFDLMVHHSRIIHVAEDLQESEFLGTSRLRAVFNRLFDWEKVVGGSGEMFWRGARPGYQAVATKEATEINTDGLQEQFDEYEHNLRRILAVQGLEFKGMDMQVTSPKDAQDAIVQAISAVTGIPKRIFTGSERGELASTEDKNSWLELTQSRRDEFAEPLIVRATVDRLIELGVLPPPKSKDGYSVVWVDLWAKSDKEKAEIGKIRAEALKAWTANPVAMDTVPPEAFNRLFLGLDDEGIALLDELQGKAINQENADFEGEDDN